MKLSISIQSSISSLLWLLILILTPPTHAVAAESATQWVARAEKQIRGEDFKAKSTLKIRRGSDERTLETYVWTKHSKEALVKIESPLKDRFGGSLRIDSSLWQYLPNVERIVPIPASLMGQSWMGSDFTNDDLMKATSWSRDYDSKILSETKATGETHIILECIPKKNAAVVWGKLILEIRKSDAALVKQEFYNERMELVKSMTGEKIQSFKGHAIPTMLKMNIAKKPENSTTIEYSEIEYDSGISDSIFSQESLKKKSFKF